MLFLIISVICLLGHIQQGQTTYSRYRDYVDLSDVERQLERIEETQTALLDKVNMLVTMQTSVVLMMSEMGVRRNEEGQTQLHLVTQEGTCFTATICPGNCSQTRTETYYRDCYDAYQDGNEEDGIYTILPVDWSGEPFEVTCDMTSDGGGWTVFQRRVDGETNFYRNWESYKHGFGSFDGDFWLGNEQLYYLAKQREYELRIDLISSQDSRIFQKYPGFAIGSESENYRLTLERGTARTGLYFNTGRDFSTFDRDNDRCSSYSCAQKHRGGWWYGGASSWCNSCYGSHCSNIVHGNCNTACTDSNLNGDYNGGNGQTIIWYRNAAGRYCNMKYADMKIRPRQ